MTTIIPVPVWMWLLALSTVGYAGYCSGYIYGINRRPKRRLSRRLP